MSGYIINGGRPLFGSVDVSGAKNAVLPILAACLLCTQGKSVLCGCPEITDVTYTIEILRLFNCDVSFDDGQITVDATSAKPAHIPSDLTGRMRSACLFLGAALSRFAVASQCMQGGCKLGSRPIDLHLDAFEKMGVLCELSDDMLFCERSPHGADIFLRFPSVGATENIILAAALAKGTTTITNAAREPEIADLCEFINACGGNIKGAGSSLIIIQGVEKLGGINYNIMGDRIEAATFLAMAMATDGEITVRNIRPDSLCAFTDVLINSGAFVCRRDSSITVRRSGHFVLSPGRVETAPFPGFPTDAQSVITALLTVAQGNTVICENIFDDRLKVADSLLQMGADIKVRGNTAHINGVRSLHCAKTRAPDLRSGAALVLAALMAKGESVIDGACYVERGYADFLPKLTALGADIKKTEDV